MRLHILIAICLAFAPQAFASVTKTPKCEPGLLPIATVPPKLPPELHNEYRGTIIVALTITKAGQVRSAKVIGKTLFPVGHGGRTPSGYDEATLKAIAQWKFPARLKDCRAQFPIQFEVD